MYDNLDFMHGVEAFTNASPARRWRPCELGSCRIGVEDNEVLLFSELMDSASLFLTANCDTLYFISFLDLSDGPMVLEVPPLGPPSGILGCIDDMWFGWVTDFGLPGPDRAHGGQLPARRTGVRRRRCPTAGTTCRTSARPERDGARSGVHDRRRPRTGWPRSSATA